MLARDTLEADEAVLAGSSPETGLTPSNSPLIEPAGAQLGMPSFQTMSVGSSCPDFAIDWISVVETGPDRVAPSRV